MILKTICIALTLGFTSSSTVLTTIGNATPAIQQEQNNIIKKTYKLKGFKQNCCTGIVNYALKEVDGFIKSEAQVKSQELTVWYDSKKCDEAAITEAINKTPYKVIIHP